MGFREQFKNPWLKAHDKFGFPKDEYSLVQLAGDNCNLDFWYYSQFVQNETTNHCRGGIRSTYLLEKTPLLDNTLTCTVYIGNTAVQVGYLKNGEILFDKIGNSEFFAESGNANLNTGEITLRWNKVPPDNFLIVSYEYNLECQPSDQ